MSLESKLISLDLLLLKEQLSYVNKYCSENVDSFVHNFYELTPEEINDSIFYLSAVFNRKEQLNKAICNLSDKLKVIDTESEVNND